MGKHIIIAGAGLMGRLSAATLAMQGHRVRVFDSGAPEHRAAAWTSAGMLSPLAEAEVAGPEVLGMGWNSIGLWKTWEERLGASGLAGLGLVCEDSLLVFHPREAPMAERALQKIPKEQVVRLARGGPNDLEPMVSPDLAGVLLPGEAYLEPRLAMASLQAFAECQSTPAEFDLSQAVVAMAPGEVRLGNGRIEQADEVWDCRGLGARDVLPVRGVRGETLLLQWPEATVKAFKLAADQSAQVGQVACAPYSNFPYPNSPYLSSAPPRRAIRRLHPRWRVYLVPRSDHRLLVGATEIESEHRGPITAESSIDLLAAAIQVMPSLAEASVVSTDSNLRPATPDNKPCRHTEPGLRRFNGLFRHGWLVAPSLLESSLCQYPLDMPNPA